MIGNWKQANGAHSRDTKVWTVRGEGGAGKGAVWVKVER